MGATEATAPPFLRVSRLLHARQGDVRTGQELCILHKTLVLAVPANSPPKPSKHFKGRPLCEVNTSGDSSIEHFV